MLNLIKAIARKILNSEISQLKQKIANLEMAPFFNVYNRNGALANVAQLEAGKKILFIDLCNVHAANHKFTQQGYDALMLEVINTTRYSDLWIKWGGDEWVCIPDTNSIDECAARLKQTMRQYCIYAVICIVTVQNDGNLQGAVIEGDNLCSAKKLELEATGQKPHRDAPYECLDSHIVRG